jgi:hypothetical protein
MKAWVFYLGLGALLTHEMDAMTHSEWRVLPVTRWLADDLGRDAFVVAHVPLYALVLGLVASLHPATRYRSRFWVSVFLMVHAVLHGLFSSDPAYTFAGALSNTLIYGAAVLGGLYLVLDRRETAQH